MKSIRKTKIINVIVLVALIISILLSAFFYYCPTDYVKTPDGEIYLVDGKPVIYHKDLFGNTFIFDDGVRVYVAIPNYAGA